MATLHGAGRRRCMAKRGGRCKAKVTNLEKQKTSSFTGQSALLGDFKGQATKPCRLHTSPSRDYRIFVEDYSYAFFRDCKITQIFQCVQKTNAHNTQRGV